MRRLVALLCLIMLAAPLWARPRVSCADDSPYSATAASILDRFLTESLRKTPRIVLEQDSSLPEDAFHIWQEGRTIHISGNGKGVVYGACDFLEQEIGMNYWGGGEYDLPRGRNLPFTLRPRTEIPTFRYRQTSHWSLQNGRVATSDNGVNRIMDADTLYRWWYRLEEPHELFVANLWVHTCNSLLPASRYGEAHPEYYAWFDGARHPGSASQWCLSNPEVLEIVCERLDSLFRANPAQSMISISQNDGSDTYCRCPACAAIIAEEGSPAGPILRFVNAVARRFPDKQISTLAYLFSVTPPAVTRPEENVSIMLCDIDCRRQTALTENPSGHEFMRSLEGWSAICDNIFLWDYGINFDNYLSPFPNLSTIRDNMQIFRSHGVKMHFSQINSTLGGDFSDLRPYLVSKLMWNADAPLDSLERHFCEAFYGDAAPYILRYIHMLEGAAVATDVDLFIYDTPVSYKGNILSPALFRRYEALFDAAEAAVASDPVKLRRVRLTRLPLQYSYLEIARTEPSRDVAAVEEALSLFESRIREFGVETLNERGNSPLDYCAMYRDRYLADNRENLAFGCPVSYIIPPKDGYAALARTALTDGLYGGTGFRENWVGWEGSDASFVIDLGRETAIQSVSVDFLRQIGAWVLEPLSVAFSVSSDGESYEPFDCVEIPENRDGTIGFLCVTGSSRAQARFVKVVVTGQKVCPEWHYGVGNPCWFFIDEVSVK